MRDPDVGLLRLSWRGVRGHCPRCDSGGVFTSWGRLASTCPGCGHRFEREPGYFVGAMIINTAIAIAGIVGVIAVGTILTSPDVPWVPLFVLTVLVGGVGPVVLYPVSKTIWAAVDLAVNPLDPAEQQAAQNALVSR